MFLIKSKEDLRAFITKQMDINGANGAASDRTVKDRAHRAGLIAGLHLALYGLDEWEKSEKSFSQMGITSEPSSPS